MRTKSINGLILFGLGVVFIVAIMGVPLFWGCDKIGPESEYGTAESDTLVANKLYHYRGFKIKITHKIEKNSFWSGTHEVTTVVWVDCRDRGIYLDNKLWDETWNQKVPIGNVEKEKRKHLRYIARQQWAKTMKRIDSYY